MQIKNKLKNILRKIGLKKKDTVLVHSNITPIVKYANLSLNEASLLLKETILEVIGSSGTLVVPTFNHDIFYNKKYTHETSRSNCGVFSNYILFQTKSIRSFHPIHSFCAIGKRTSNLMYNISNSSTGPKSVFDKLYKINAKILLFNFDIGTTFVHYIEQKKKVNYRYLKKIRGVVSKNNKEYIDEFDMYVRFLNIDVQVSFKKLHDCMISKKKMKRLVILNNTLSINLTTCKKMYDETIKMLDIKPYFLLKKNPFN